MYYICSGEAKNATEAIQFSLEQCSPLPNTLQPPMYSVQLASDLGRLDLVSTLLALLGLFLIFAAFGWVAYLKWKAEKLAQETANQVAKDTAEEVSNLHLQAVLPEILKAYDSFARNSIEPNIADLIAEAQENGVEGQDNDDA